MNGKIVDEKHLISDDLVQWLGERTSFSNMMGEETPIHYIVHNECAYCDSELIQNHLEDYKNRNPNENDYYIYIDIPTYENEAERHWIDVMVIYPKTIKDNYFLTGTRATYEKMEEEIKEKVESVLATQSSIRKTITHYMKPANFTDALPYIVLLLVLVLGVMTFLM